MHLQVFGVCTYYSSFAGTLWNDFICVTCTKQPYKQNASNFLPHFHWTFLNQWEFILTWKGRNQIFILWKNLIHESSRSKTSPKSQAQTLMKCFSSVNSPIITKLNSKTILALTFYLKRYFLILLIYLSVCHNWVILASLAKMNKERKPVAATAFLLAKEVLIFWSNVVLFSLMEKYVNFFIKGVRESGSWAVITTEPNCCLLEN